MQKGVSKGNSYKMGQVFGYKGPNEKIMEEDIISCIKFDKSGKSLALGDKAGRIIIFQASDSPKSKPEYDYFTEFQSHEKEFDPLRSMDIEEEIKDINWLCKQGPYMKMTTTNDRSIKLWKVFEQTEKRVVRSSGSDLNVPKLQNVQSSPTSQLQISFAPKHLSPINSISSSNNEHFLLSSDDVQTFLWSYQKYSQPFLVTNLLKTDKIEDAKETITFSKLHPTSDTTFVYGTNKGGLKLCDLRLSPSCDGAVSFKSEGGSGQKNFLTQMMSCYSSGEFTRNGKYLVSRDFLSVKVWDVCNGKKPVSSIVVQEGVKGKLCEMFENDCIFDKFSVATSPDCNTVFTGNYNNSFNLVDLDATNTQYELNFKKTTLSKPILPGKVPPVNKMDYLHKVLAGDFSSSRNVLAVASLNCFYIYSM